MSEQYGFSDKSLETIHKMMDEAIRDGRIQSGIAMLARGDEIFWLRTAGDMGPGIPMRDDVIIPLASAGKMYTAVAAMILCEQGVISLDDPVSKYIPEYSDIFIEVTHPDGETKLEAPKPPITVHHLLTHTGGLQVNGDGFWTAWNAHSGRTTTTELARALAKLPLQFQPGEGFDYGPTGASYEVLGAVIEISSNQTLEAFMIENIFEPLGLIDTHFYLPVEKADRMPAFYRSVDGLLQLDRPYGVDFQRTTFFHGGGGVEASPQDIVRFTQLFLNKGIVNGVRLLSPKTVDLMMTDHLGEKSPFGNGLSWGLGAAVSVTQQGKPMQYGWVGGGYATIWVDLREKLVAYFAFPVMPPGDTALLNGFRSLVYRALL